MINYRRENPNLFKLASEETINHQLRILHLFISSQAYTIKQQLLLNISELFGDRQQMCSRMLTRLKSKNDRASFVYLILISQLMNIIILHNTVAKSEIVINFCSNQSQINTIIKLYRIQAVVFPIRDATPTKPCLPSSPRPATSYTQKKKKKIKRKKKPKLFYDQTQQTKYFAPFPRVAIIKHLYIL